MRAIRIVSCSGFATFQDSGRHGVAHLAVPSGGAFDSESYALANRLLGNDANAAVIESARASLVLEALSECEIVVTGAPVSIRVNGLEQAMNQPLYVSAQSMVTLSPTQLALRSYLGVRGGFDVPAIMGSRSFDELAKLGPAPIGASDVIPVGNAIANDMPVVLGPVTGVSLASDVELGVWRGPRWDWFSDAMELVHHEFVVTTKINRVGVRLEGHAFSWDTTRRLPSEGLVRGSIQIPVDGVPLIFGPDHPTTAGYPVIGVIEPSHMSRLAQVTAGTRMRFSIRS